eukprot:1032772-Amphidinium_carterae.2
MKGEVLLAMGAWDVLPAGRLTMNSPMGSPRVIRTEDWKHICEHKTMRCNGNIPSQKQHFNL